MIKIDFNHPLFIMTDAKSCVLDSMHNLLGSEDWVFTSPVHDYRFPWQQNVKWHHTEGDVRFTNCSIEPIYHNSLTSAFPEELNQLHPTHEDVVFPVLIGYRSGQLPHMVAAYLHKDGVRVFNSCAKAAVDCDSIKEYLGQNPLIGAYALVERSRNSGDDFMQFYRK